MAFRECFLASFNDGVCENISKMRSIMTQSGQDVSKFNKLLDEYLSDRICCDDLIRGVDGIMPGGMAQSMLSNLKQAGVNACDRARTIDLNWYDSVRRVAPLNEKIKTVAERTYNSIVNRRRRRKIADTPISIPFSADAAWPLTSTPTLTIDYNDTHNSILTTAEKYLRKNNIARIPEAIFEFIDRLRLIHRCSPFQLMSILQSGQILSRDAIEDVGQHAQLILKTPYMVYITEKYAPTGKFYDALKFIAANIMEPPPRRGIARAFRTLSAHGVDDAEILYLEQHCIEQMTRIDHIRQEKVGMKVHKDVEIGTDKTVFAILGPHIGAQYGAISIAINRHALSHVNSNITMCAGTSHYNPLIRSQKPYMPSKVVRGAPLFMTQVIHLGVEGGREAIATQVAAHMVAHDFPVTHDMSTDDVLRWWMLMNSHRVIEAHLPCISVDYIEKVFVPAQVYNSLCAEGLTKYIPEEKIEVTLLGDDDWCIAAGMGDQLVVNRSIYLEIMRDQTIRLPLKSRHTDCMLLTFTILDEDSTIVAILSDIGSVVISPGEIYMHDTPLPSNTRVAIVRDGTPRRVRISVLYPVAITVYINDVEYYTEKLNEHKFSYTSVTFSTLSAIARVRDIVFN
jgi:hypothetical protein